MKFLCTLCYHSKTSLRICLVLFSVTFHHSKWFILDFPYPDMYWNSLFQGIKPNSISEFLNKAARMKLPVHNLRYTQTKTKLTLDKHNQGTSNLRHIKPQTKNTGLPTTNKIKMPFSYTAYGYWKAHKGRYNNFLNFRSFDEIGSFN